MTGRKREKEVERERRVTDKERVREKDHERKTEREKEKVKERQAVRERDARNACKYSRIQQTDKNMNEWMSEWIIGMSNSIFSN